MQDLEEKRVYDETTGRSELVVGSEMGALTVSVSGGRVGEFGIDHRCRAHDVAQGGAVATDEDVRVGESYEPTGFGPAVAVTDTEDALVAADADGRVARLGDEGSGEWTTVGRVGEVRALDGRLVATADGVYRVAGDGLRPAGLDDARDVADRGAPLAATGTGLYRLANGWVDVLDGAVRTVAAAEDGRGHAATVDRMFARADGAWTPVDLPTDEPVAGVAYAGGTVAVATEPGTLLLDAGDGWRAHPLGVPGVCGVAARDGNTFTAG